MAGFVKPDSEANHGLTVPSLQGRRVLVTRAERDARDLIRTLERRGAACAAVPLIHIGPPVSWEPLDEALARLREYDWLLLTSRNAVRAFFERWARQTSRPDWPSGLRVGVVGPGTSDELEKHGLAPDLVPATATALGLLEALRRSGGPLSGVRFLLPRARVARPELPAGLQAAGAHVDAVTAYQTDPQWESGPRLRLLLEQGWPNVITFASGSAVESCLKLLAPHAVQLLDKVAVAAIGPTTAVTARQHGLAVDCVADPHTVPGLVDALADCDASSRASSRR